MQWGRMVNGSNTFPIPFPHEAFRLVSANRPAWSSVSGSTLYSMSNTGFYVSDLGVGDSWKVESDYIVFGY